MSLLHKEGNVETKGANGRTHWWSWSGLGRFPQHDRLMTG